ncbi:PAP2 superfamily protein [compost metagenome]
MTAWLAFTKLADTNFTMPLAALLAVWLAAARAWRPALCWFLLFVVGLLLVAATKIAYVGWGLGIAAIDFKGFSGHAMRAMAVAPVFMYLLLQEQGARKLRLGVLAGLGFGLMIGISRLALGVHSVSEVITGLLLGAVISLGFIAYCRPHATIVFDRKLLIIGTIALFPILTLKPAPTEGWIERIAIYLSGNEHNLHRHPTGPTQ